MTAKQSKNFLLLFTAAVIWGVAFVAQSVGMDYVGPYTFNMIRTLLGGLVLIPCIFLLGRKNVRKDHDGSQSSQTFDRPRDLFIGGGLCGLMLFISTSLQQVSTLGNSQPLKTLRFQSTSFFLHLHFSVGVLSVSYIFIRKFLNPY